MSWQLMTEKSKKKKRGSVDKEKLHQLKKHFNRLHFFQLLFNSESITVQWDELVGGWNWWIGNYLTGGMSWINDYKYICCQWLNSYRHRNSKLFKHCFCKNINTRYINTAQGWQRKYWGDIEGRLVWDSDRCGTSRWNVCFLFNLCLSNKKFGQ